jgi:phenylacetate-CoA ligase
LAKLYPSWAINAYSYVKLTRAYLRKQLNKTYYRVWNPWFLEENQWRTGEEILELQQEGLNALLEHAKKNTSYYKELPKIGSIEELAELPILSKDDIHRNFKELQVKNIPGQEVRTSGTVSKSTYIKDDRLNVDWGEHRFQKWYNVPNKKLCYLWSTYDITDKPLLYSNRLYLPIDTMNTREDAIDYLGLIEKFKPDRMQTYPSSIRFLAHFALKEGIKPEIGVIYSSAEMLTNEVRKLIEEAFHCKVYDFYGSRELGSMAQNCDENHDLHINAERYIVEEVEGKLLFTDLLNYAMPLIRYENQDLGELSNSACPCGRGLPLMKPPTGRITDFLYTSSGKWIRPNSHNILSGSDMFQWSSGWQFIQEEQGKVIVVLQPWDDIEEIPSIHLLESTLQTLWPIEEMEVKCEIVEALRLSPSGKQIKLIRPFHPWNT